MFEYLIQRKILWFFAIVIVGVFVQFSLDVIFSLIYKSQDLYSHWTNYLISIGVSLVVMYGLVYITRWINTRFAWERSAGARFYIQVIFITLAMVVMVMLARNIINFTLFPQNFIRLLDEIIIAIYFAVFGLLLVFMDIGVNLLSKWRFSLAEVEKFKKENLETQFEMLRTQVNPHFLFNSLNTLSSLIYQDQDVASNFVRELSSVYRYILEKRKTDIVNLKEEMDFTDSYRYLLGLRFDQKLIFKIAIDEKLMDKYIVPLTLQILIENAVKHNIISSRKPLTISIISRDGAIEVSNNLQKKNEETYSSGIGLNNIGSRLKIMTHRELKVEETTESFKVVIPLLDKHEINKLNIKS